MSYIDPSGTMTINSTNQQGGLILGSSNAAQQPAMFLQWSGVSRSMIYQAQQDLFLLGATTGTPTMNFGAGAIVSSLGTAIGTDATSITYYGPSAANWGKWTSTGLGIGATSPGAKLVVSGSTVIGNNIGTRAAKAQLDVVGTKDASNNRINPAKEDGNLATIKTNTDGLTASGGGGYVRQDSTGTIAKESGGNLASIKTNTDTFTASGAGGYIRQDSTGTIAKESGGNLATIATNVPAKGQAAMADSMPVVIASDQPAIPVAGSFSVEAVGIKDTAGTIVNPATDDAVVYLRRMVKLMESQATVDAGNRQRITIDSLGTGTAVTTTIPVSGTVTVGTISTVTSLTNMVTLAGQNQQMFQDVARNAYANGIRQNLIFI
jgi:hypothetical protein